MLTWKPEFETGSPLVDGQHKILIDKINRLEQLMQAAVINKRDVDLLLDFLGSYVATHFKFEEQCMEHHHCPAHVENKVAHAQFTGALEAWKKDYAVKGATKEVLGKLHATASAWIQNHIMKIDVQLRPCMKR